VNGLAVATPRKPVLEEFNFADCAIGVRSVRGDGDVSGLENVAFVSWARDIHPMALYSRRGLTMRMTALEMVTAPPLSVAAAVRRYVPPEYSSS